MRESQLGHRCYKWILLPDDAVLVLLLDQADSLEDVGDVVDAALLLHVQRVRGLRK